MKEQQPVDLTADRVQESLDRALEGVRRLFRTQSIEAAKAERQRQEDENRRYARYGTTATQTLAMFNSK